MKTLTMPPFVAGCLLLAFLGACEEGKKPEAEPQATAAATPAPTPTPAPAPTPTEEAKPARPKKKLSDCPAGNDVTIEDKAVEAQVRLKLDKADGALTKADLKRVKSLNLSQVKLDELDPCLFAPMTALKELFLGQGDYDDLSPIAGATQLESLRASINKVKDLTPLEKLTKLDRLDLGRTLVKDLKPLEKLTLLTELQLDGTEIEDISPLAKLEKLEVLSIKNTKVKDASPLKGLKKLKTLYIGGTPLDDDPMSIGPLRANGTKIMTN
jgi:internalin A